MYNNYKKKIIGFYETHRRMPGYLEIMRLLGFKSKNSVYKLIKKMVEDGIVDKDSRGHLIPTKSFNEVPILGLVEAGIPTYAESGMSETTSIDDYLVKKRDQSYLLEVKGDSMIEEGIKEGDLVLVEKTDTAKDGDIVIAEVDGGWTMKYFRKKKEVVYLEPANRNYKDIYPEYEFRVAAVVKGVIRKYGK